MDAQKVNNAHHVMKNDPIRKKSSEIQR